MLNCRKEMIERLIKLTTKDQVEWGCGSGEDLENLKFSFFVCDLNKWKFELHVDQDNYILSIDQKKYNKIFFIDYIDGTNCHHEELESLYNIIVSKTENYNEFFSDLENLNEEEEDNDLFKGIDKKEEDEILNDENRYIWSESFEIWLDDKLEKSSENTDWDLDDIEAAYQAGFEEAMKRKFKFASDKGDVQIIAEEEPEEEPEFWGIKQSRIEEMKKNANKEEI